MFARNFATSRKRRGVVLVVILGMLGLLALVGVTFATFSGQSLISSRKFSEGGKLPTSSDVTDFAMSQLLFDTDTLTSALRGHSLLRDMYGNDGRFNGSLAALPAPYGTQLHFLPISGTANGFRPNPNPGPFANYPQFLINVPVDQTIPALYGVNFTRWYLRVNAFTSITGAGSPAFYHPAQTFEVLFDDNTGSDPASAATDPVSGISARMHLVTLLPLDPLNAANSTLYDELTALPVNNNNNPYDNFIDASNNAHSYNGSSTALALPLSLDAFNNPVSIVLDGRFLRAFNGPGMSALSHNWPVNPNQNVAISAPMYGNFRINGGLLSGVPTAATPGNPDAVGMDEDYDAPDLENWFLALQSADGSVVIPSFHRPGILVSDVNNANPLDPSGTVPYDDWIANTPSSAAKILRPRGVDHPAGNFGALRPNVTGHINYDVDNDGDGVTDAVWLDLGYQPIPDPTGKMYKPLFAFTVIGLNGRMPLNTAGNLQKRDFIDYNGDGNPDCAPTWDHNSHLGYSVSEINPKYALQNHPGVGYSQSDDVGLNVELTQLRNLLAGTRPQINPYVLPTILPNAAYPNGDTNFVQMGTQLDPISNTAVPRFIWMPNNIFDNDDTSSADPVTGNTVVQRLAPAVAGRWGEPQGVPQALISPANLPNAGALPASYLLYNNFVRAGISAGVAPMNYSQFNYNIDQTDDNYTAYDFWGTTAASANIPPGSQNPEALDLFDKAGFSSLPSERMRRFFAPVDVEGTGRVFAFGYNPITLGLGDNDFGTGFDKFGRVSFFRYFRPPGVPVPIDNVLTSPGLANPPSLATGNAAVVPDMTTNLYHGLESARYPSTAISNGNTTSPDSQLPAAMSGAAAYIMPATGTYGLPTFTYPPPAQNVTAADPSYGPFAITPAPNPLPNVFSTYLMGSLGRDEADEMNLYNPTEVDAPFGPADLEWLYRKHDTDGASLDSRLAKLAPVSFTNDQDAVMRRRMFSINTWETTNFIWASDNPVSMPNFPGPAITAGTGQFPLNSRFNAATNSNYSAGNLYANPLTAPYLYLNAGYGENIGAANVAMNIDGRTITPLTPTSPLAPAVPIPVPTYPVAHRDRKINLNFPLPVSNSPLEPVRQKWIRETYQTLKAVLPPQAVDTPQELAALSQFVVNIIDFRDTDATCTRFVNTDITMKVKPTTTTPATWQFNTAALPSHVGPPPTPGYPYDPTYADPANVGDFLVQYGMEYSPVAINEVLAYSFARDGGSGTPVSTPRLFIELVNTLTDGAAGNPSDLDMAGWKFVVAPDDPTGRPDPITGQFPPGTTVTPHPVMDPTAIPPRVRALRTGGPTAPYYYVLSTPSPAPATDVGLPSVQNGKLDATLIPTPPPFAALSSQARYYWLYLTRPIDPLDTAGTVYPQQIVVDAIRFPYIEAGGTLGGNPPMVTKAGDNALYSVQRLQPYRGGQMIPAAATPPVVEETLHPYGWSEQLATAQNGITTMQGQFNGKAITGLFYHTLGAANSDQNGNSETSWDYFPFHDRDFASVAELLMVPGCPPGLFTKHFTEIAPGNASATPPTDFPNSTAQTTPTVGATPPRYPNAGVAFPTINLTNPSTHAYMAPHTFPYLADNFFYSAGQDAGGIVGGPASGGWHKMLELFEVPSSSFGAIGPVDQGQNFDWLRQDLKPGQLNLNLIIDEEVFLGLVDDPRLNYAQTVPVPPVNPTAFNPIPPPQVVTQVSATGAPNATYAMNNRGYYAVDPISGSAGNLMKAAFSDFLKLRHGGSGYMFAWGMGFTGTPQLAGTVTPPMDPHFVHGVAAELPFRSLSYPDIDDTVMRPATLAPSLYSTPPAAPATPGPYVGDPGVKSPKLFPSVPPLPGWVDQPPAVPPRRMFQVPDDLNASPTGTPPPTGVTVTNAPTPPAYSMNASNASESGDPFVNTPVQDVNLYNGAADLISPTIATPTAPPVPYSAWLGGQTSTAVPPAPDLRQHPYFRTEMLQKVMNLTTVRTHQFAVWVTVGFFEVVQTGNPQFGIPDQLGQEVGLANGRNIRYRTFFIIDRTKAVGFNSPWPGVASEDFRDCVIYRRKIE